MDALDHGSRLDLRGLTRRQVLAYMAMTVSLPGIAKGALQTRTAGSTTASANKISATVLVAVEESDSSVGIFDSATGFELGRVSVGHWPHEIEINRAGTTAYVTNFGLKDYDEKIGTAGDSISVIDLRSCCEVERLFTFIDRSDWGHYRAPHGIKLSPDETRLFVNAEVGDAMLVFDLSTPGNRTAKVLFEHSRSVADDTSYETTFPLAPKAHNFIFSQDGMELFVAAGLNGLRKVDSSSGKEIARFERPSSAIRGVDFTADRKSLIVSGSNEICVIDPRTLAVQLVIGDLNARQLLYSEPTPDGRYILAPAVWEGELLVIDLPNRKVVRRLIVGADPIHLAIPSSGDVAFLSHGRSRYISKISLRTFTETRRIATRGGPNGIALAPRQARPFARQALLRVGACIPLSGVNFNEGHDLRLGYQLWQEVLNAAGGLKVLEKNYRIEMCFQDSQSSINEKLVGALTEKLITEEGCQFILGGYPSPPNEYSARVANSHRIPFITASGAAERIYQQGFQYVFGIMSSAASFLKGTFEYLKTLTSPPRSALFLSCSDPAAHQDADTTAAIVENEMGIAAFTPQGTMAKVAGRVLVFEHLQDSSKNSIESLKEVYKSVLGKASGNGLPDVLVHTGHLPEAVALVQVAKEMAYLPKGFAFSVGPAMPQFATQLGRDAENMLGAAMWTPGQNEAGHDRFVRPQEFVKVFWDRFSAQPSYLAAGAMACGVVLEDAVRRADSISGEAVRDALRATNFPTFYSRVAFDSRGLNVGRPLVSIQLQPGEGGLRQVPLWPRDLAGESQAVWPFPGWDATKVSPLNVVESIY